jgi:hypothetical protein
MNAFVSALENTNTDSITVKLVGQNFTTGDQYYGRVIPLNFFETALANGDEIEVQSLEINGFWFSGDAISGYKEIHQFLETLNDNEYDIEIGVIHAIMKEAGLTDLDNVFEYAESHVMAHSLDASEFGMSDLRENYGQERSNEALENINQNLSQSQQEQLALYWNHQQFIDDLFINECKFLSCGKVQVVISNR